MLAPTIVTERLILKGLDASLFGQQHAFMSDPRVMAFIGAGAPRQREESWRRFCAGAGMWPLLGYGYWAFTDRHTGAMIGMGGLANFEREVAALEGYPEAGWAFAANVWGHGFATEAMTAVVEWADAHLARDIRCIIDPANTASEHVAKKLGFVPFGVTEYQHSIVGVHHRPAACP
jgi:RimJ/RimL family protein N-acetyltransferase